MKYHGCILEFTWQRNDELMKAYRQAIADRKCIDIEQISNEIVKMPCTRFWVSEERAMVVIAAIIKGKNILKTMRNTKRKMFLEIHRRVIALMKGNTSMSLYDAVIKVVNSPAPEFYMKPRCAMEIIYKIKKGFYDNLRRR